MKWTKVRVKTKARVLRVAAMPRIEFLPSSSRPRTTPNTSRWNSKGRAWRRQILRVLLIRLSTRTIGKRVGEKFAHLWIKTELH